MSDEEKGKYLKKLSDAHRRRSVAQELIRKNKERATKNNWSDSKRSQYLLNQSLSHKGRKVFTDGKTVIRCLPQDAPKGFYLGGLNKNKFKYIICFHYSPLHNLLSHQQPLKQNYILLLLYFYCFLN